MDRSWLRLHPIAQLVLRMILSLVVAAALGISIYLALVTPSRETKEARNEIRKEAQALCGFTQSVDSTIGIAINPKNAPEPTTAAGQSLRFGLVGLQMSARKASQSSICQLAAPVSSSPAPKR